MSSLESIPPPENLTENSAGGIFSSRRRVLFAALVFVIFVVAAFAAGRSCAGNGTEPAQSSSDFSEICLRLEQHAETLLMPAVFCALRDGFFGELRYKRRFDRKDLPKFSKGGFEYYHTLTFHATEVMENPKEI